MNCFPCFQKKEEDEENNAGNDNLPVAQPKETPQPHAAHKELEQEPIFAEDDRATKNFTFRELAMATKNFRQECLLGEGGFGRMYKGTLKGSRQIVAVRQLDRNGMQQGGQEFILEIAKLNLLEHPNLLRLIGYCADGDQRLLVYEHMPMGSLASQLFDLPAGKKALDWTTRMKIALGVADGLEYLHEKVDPPLIYRDLKSSNILLDEDNSPRLSEYGLANFMETGNKMHTPKVISDGYCAPEYEYQGELSAKSDVYNFGVVLLELISGRKALDPTKPTDEQKLVSWAQPYFKDQSKFAALADPLLRGGFSATSLNQAVGVAAMCLQEEPSARPLISDISAALSFLAMAPPETSIPDRLVPILSTRVSSISQHNDTSVSRKHDIPGESDVADTSFDSSNKLDSDKKDNNEKLDSDKKDNNDKLDSYKKDNNDKLDSEKKDNNERSNSRSVSKRKSTKNPDRSKSRAKSMKSCSSSTKNPDRSKSHAKSIKNRSSSRSSSSSDSDIDFSLRCKTAYPDRSYFQDEMDDDYGDRSGSDKEPMNDNPDSE